MYVTRLPQIWSSEIQVEYLTWIEQPLKFLQQFGALVTARFWIYKYYHRCYIGRRNWFNNESSLIFFFRLKQKKSQKNVAKLEGR